jgi:hypothetical protein
MSNIQKQYDLACAIDAKTEEIEKYVSKQLGFGDPDKLPDDRKAVLAEEVGQLIDEHDEAVLGAPAAAESRMKASELGRLLLERHELCEQYLDLRDSDIK